MRNEDVAPCGFVISYIDPMDRGPRLCQGMPAKAVVVGDAGHPSPDFEAMINIAPIDNPAGA